ncbi:MAG: DUF397 domain-containing protein [Nocardioides sp.]
MVSQWKKSSFSGDDCLEWRTDSEGVMVRHSREPTGTSLRFSVAEWRAFIDGARAGEADLTSPDLHGPNAD